MGEKKEKYIHGYKTRNIYIAEKEDFTISSWFIFRVVQMA